MIVFDALGSAEIRKVADRGHQSIHGCDVARTSQFGCIGVVRPGMPELGGSSATRITEAGLSFGDSGPAEMNGCQQFVAQKRSVMFHSQVESSI